MDCNHLRTRNVEHRIDRTSTQRYRFELLGSSRGRRDECGPAYIWPSSGRCSNSRHVTRRITTIKRSAPCTHAPQRRIQRTHGAFISRPTCITAHRRGGICPHSNFNTRQSSPHMSLVHPTASTAHLADFHPHAHTWMGQRTPGIDTRCCLHATLPGGWVASR
jgi:hypothetical protein